MNNQIEIEILDTPDKYYTTADTIITQLLELLQELSSLEKEIYERNKILEQEKFKAGIPYNQTAPGFKELLTDYYERYGRLVTPRCTERLLKRGYARSFGKPGKYDDVNTNCKMICTMKSSKKAIIETFSHKEVATRYQFIIKITDNEWKIDEIKYAFMNETTWHIDHV